MMYRLFVEHAITKWGKHNYYCSHCKQIISTKKELKLKHHTKIIKHRMAVTLWHHIPQTDEVQKLKSQTDENYIFLMENNICFIKDTYFCNFCCNKMPDFATVVKHVYENNHKLHVEIDLEDLKSNGICVKNLCYYCKFCVNEVDKTAVSIKSHIEDEKHLENKQNFEEARNKAHLRRQAKKKGKEELVKLTEQKKMDQFVLLENGIIFISNAHIKCILCNVALNGDTLFRHLRNKVHLYNLFRQSLVNVNKKKSKTNVSNYFFCKKCNIPIVTDDLLIQCHSMVHLLKENSNMTCDIIKYFESSKVNVVICLLCNEEMSTYPDVMNHVKKIVHLQNLQINLMTENEKKCDQTFSLIKKRFSIKNSELNPKDYLDTLSVCSVCYEPKPLCSFNENSKNFKFDEQLPTNENHNHVDTVITTYTDYFNIYRCFLCNKSYKNVELLFEHYNYDFVHAHRLENLNVILNDPNRKELSVLNASIHKAYNLNSIEIYINELGEKELNKLQMLWEKINKKYDQKNKYLILQENSITEVEAKYHCKVCKKKFPLTVLWLHIFFKNHLKNLHCKKLSPANNGFDKLSTFKKNEYCYCKRCNFYFSMSEIMVQYHCLLHLHQEHENFDVIRFSKGTATCLLCNYEAKNNKDFENHVESMLHLQKLQLNLFVKSQREGINVRSVDEKKSSESSLFDPKTQLLLKTFCSTCYEPPSSDKNGNIYIFQQRPNLQCHENVACEKKLHERFNFYRCFLCDRSFNDRESIVEHYKADPVHRHRYRNFIAKADITEISCDVNNEDAIEPNCGNTSPIPEQRDDEDDDDDSPRSDCQGTSDEWFFATPSKVESRYPIGAYEIIYGDKKDEESTGNKNDESSGGIGRNTSDDWLSVASEAERPVGQKKRDSDKNPGNECARAKSKDGVKNPSINANYPGIVLNNGEIEKIRENLASLLTKVPEVNQPSEIKIEESGAFSSDRKTFECYYCNICKIYIKTLFGCVIIHCMAHLRLSDATNDIIRFAFNDQRLVITCLLCDVTMHTYNNFRKHLKLRIHINNLELICKDTTTNCMAVNGKSIDDSPESDFNPQTNFTVYKFCRDCYSIDLDENNYFHDFEYSPDSNHSECKNDLIPLTIPPDSTRTFFRCYTCSMLFVEKEELFRHYATDSTHLSRLEIFRARFGVPDAGKKRSETPVKTFREADVEAVTGLVTTANTTITTSAVNHDNNVRVAPMIDDDIVKYGAKYLAMCIEPGELNIYNFKPEEIELMRFGVSLMFTGKNNRFCIPCAIDIPLDLTNLYQHLMLEKHARNVNDIKNGKKKSKDHPLCGLDLARSSLYEPSTSDAPLKCLVCTEAVNSNVVDIVSHITLPVHVANVNSWINDTRSLNDELIHLLRNEYWYHASEFSCEACGTSTSNEFIFVQHLELPDHLDKVESNPYKHEFAINKCLACFGCWYGRPAHLGHRRTKFHQKFKLGIELFPKLSRDTRKLLMFPNAILEKLLPKETNGLNRDTCDVGLESVMLNYDILSSFLNVVDVEKSMLISKFVKAHKGCEETIVYLKKWFEVVDLYGAKAMNAYNITLLTIFYLQTKDFFPSAYELITKKNQSKLVNGWECGFPEKVYTKKNNESKFKKLLEDFFLFYSKFNYCSYVICPFLGKSVKKRNFLSIDEIPREMNIYNNRLKTGESKYFKFDSPMCLQDPIDLSLNLTKNITKSQTRLFRQFCHESYIKLHNGLNFDL